MAAVTVFKTLLLTTSLMLASMPAQAMAETGWPDEDRVTVLMKFLPKPGESAIGQVKFDALSCHACEQLHDPAFERFNSRESILQLRIPRGRFLELTFDAAGNDASRVLVNNQELPVRRNGSRIKVELPPINKDAIWAAAMATEIVETGVTLRFEHADPARRAGAYADGPFPDLERKAANNLTFAQREVIRRLDLGNYVARENIGQIMLMGFDTNFPAAHTDAPPHIHMHLRWANNIGTQISHFYIGSDGLLTENRVGVRGMNAPSRTFVRGQAFTTIDRFGRAVFTHQITDKGALTISTPSGASCALSPVGLGFHEGVSIGCNDRPPMSLKVTDDQKSGTITVTSGILTEIIRFDPQTGILLSPQSELSIPASAISPL